MARQPSAHSRRRGWPAGALVALVLAGCEALPCPNGTAPVRLADEASVTRFCVDADRVRQGPYQRTCADGSLQVVGAYADGEMMGVWTEWTRVSCGPDDPTLPETLEVDFSR